MTEPRDNGPMGPDGLATLAGLDLALDELAAGRDLLAAPGGEAAALATLAAELRAAVPAPPPGAAERGRAAFLATAEDGKAVARIALGGRAGGGATWRRRSLPMRLAGLAAALVVLVALPAAARQAEPGTTLWPVREVGQQVRDRLADPVDRASLRLSTAEEYLAAGTGAGEERRKDMADAAEEKIKDALDALKDLTGPEVAAAQGRAARLEAQVEALERQKDDGHSGSGGGTESGDDRSGPGGSDDRSANGDSGPGGGDDRGPGPGETGSGDD